MLKLDVVHRKGTFTLETAFEAREHVTGLVGKSGSGKTTLLHLIAGLENPKSGRVEVDGRVLFDDRAGICVPPHQRRLGLVFQDSRLLPHYSVRGNLHYGERILKSVERRVDSDVVVGLLELGDLLDRRVQNLSGGERQRVALGRALLASPRILLLDEPLASLDIALKRQILPFLRRVRDALGIPMVYVCHDLSETLQLTGALVLLEKGRVVGAGTLSELVGRTEALRGITSLGLLNVLELKLASQSEGEGLATFELPGGRQLRGPPVPLEDRPAVPSRRVTLAIRPEDIALSLATLGGISIQNQLQGDIVKITPHDGRGLVEVEAGVRLLVEVSLKTVSDLLLSPGAKVVCLVKANAVRYL